MLDPCGGLLMFLIVVAILAAVGHGIWVFTAALFRAVLGQQAVLQKVRCPQCQRELRISHGKCFWCKCALELPPELRPVESARQFEAKLQWLVSRGVIDQAEFQRIGEGLRSQVDHRPAAAVPASQPIHVTRPAVDIILSETEPAPASAAPIVISTPVTLDIETPKAPVARPDVAGHLKAIAAEIKFPAAPPPPQPGPSPALADLMRSFMNENNIRWGELISGLLIVGSAIGLVISLWETLKESIPYFPALLFMFVTAAIHGAGMYTLHRWNLKSTSRGLLLISLFLIPLNYLAAVALSDHRSATDPLFLAAMGTGLVVFSTMSYFAGRKLLLAGWWLVPVAVMGASAGQVLISRLAAPRLDTSSVTLLFLLPLGSFLASSLGQLVMASRWPRLTVRRATQVFLVEGVAAFALIVAAGILVWKCHADGLRLILAQLAPSLSVVAAVMLGTGGLVRRRMTDEKLALWHTAGTSVALAGGAGMLICLVLAWPRPELLVAVGLVNALAATVFALVLEVAALHVVAILSIAFSSLIGFHLFRGNLHFGLDGTSETLRTVLLWGQSGFALMCFSGLSAAGSAAWRKCRRALDAEAYLYGTIGLGIASSLIAAYSGFWSGIGGDLATVTFAIDAIALLIANQLLWNRTRVQSILGWAGSVLLLAALVHGLGWNGTVQQFLTGMGWQPARPVVVALLLHGTILVALGFVVPHKLREAGDGAAESRRAFVKVRSASALASTMVIPFVMLLAIGDPLLTRSGYGFWASTVWMGAAFLHESAAWLAAAQVLATVALSFAVTGVCEKQAWWSEMLGARLVKSRALRSPLHLQAQIGVLAVWSTLWVGMRRLWRGNVLIQEVTIDRIVLGVVVIAVPMLAALGCIPGAAAELHLVAPASSLNDLGWILALAIVASASALGASVAAAFRQTSNPVSPQHQQTWQYALLAVFIILGTSLLALPIGKDVASAYWNTAGGSTASVYGAGGWLVTFIVAFALRMSLYEKSSGAVMFGWLWLLLSIPLLYAGLFETETATATALRWSMAVYGGLTPLALGALALWTNQSQVMRQVRNLSYAQYTALALSSLSVLVLTLDTVVPAAMQGMLRGPAAGSFFMKLGTDWSLAVPLLILAATYCAFALRDRLPKLALATSFALQLAVAAFIAGGVSARGVSIHSDTLVEFVQANGIVLGVFSLAWFALRERLNGPTIESATNDREAWSPLNVQILITSIMALIPPVWAMTDIITFPGHLPEVMRVLGAAASYAALGLAIAAAVLVFRDRLVRWGIAGACITGLAVVGLFAASSASGNAPENWVSYHILMAGWMLLAFLATTACLVPGEIRQAFAALSRSTAADCQLPTDNSPSELQQLTSSASRMTTVVGALALFLAARGVATDPARPYWGVATAGCLAFLATILALWRRSQYYAYTSARLAALAATYAWTTPWLHLGLTPTPQAWINLTQATAIAATVASAFWLAIELWFIRQRGTPFDATFTYPPVHRGTSRMALILACGLSVTGLVGRWLAFDFTNSIPFAVSNEGGWLLAALLAGVFIGSLWDIRAKRALPSLYSLGLSTAALIIDRWGVFGNHVPYFIGQALAVYILLTSVTWKIRERARGWAQRHEIPEPADLVERTGAWLPDATLFLAALVAGIAVWVVLTFHELRWRLAGAAAVAVCSICLPAFAQVKRQTSFRETGLLIAALAAIDFGWAAMPVEDIPHIWLLRTVRLLVVLAATTFVYGAVSIRFIPAANEWFTPLRRAATALGIASLGSLVALLAQEAYWFNPDSGAPLDGVQILSVAVVLVALAATLISLGVLPGRDPLELSEAGRMLYVYAAEAVLALLFLHIYLTMPELFKGYFLPWWPYIVMGIAFFGVGVGELFSRSGLRVLSEPLHRTGAFLPLLPALGFWIHTSNGDYSTLLFVVGLMYVAVSMWRKSFIYNLAAALAGNAGLWALWHEQGVPLFDHPQLWLIPPALSVLTAVQLNRRRLAEEQVTALRYLCITIIYVSSTGDVFITGVAESLLMPMILAALSVAGAFAGIALRIRAFLYMGLSFLLLSIVSMVWHAARNINHVWPWWAFGIGLGLAILTVLGVFEKKRKEVQVWLGEFRTWEA